MSWLNHSSDRPLWADEGDEVVYVITVADVIGVYEDEEDNPGRKWADFTASEKRELIRTVEGYLDGFMSGGQYTWADAIKDAIDNATERTKRKG
jgi:hypothetical protein